MSCGNKKPITEMEKSTSKVAEDPFATPRRLMVERQLKGRDIDDPLVLTAMKTVPRHEFVPQEQMAYAYGDHPLPVGYNQTISQPYIVAFMSQALKGQKGQKILEIGTGSGYQAAVLAAMGIDVYTIEIVEALGKRAAHTLQRLGYTVTTHIGDGYEGMPEHAPFDGILVTAAPKEIPPPLVAQLKENGRMVIPVGDTHGPQELQVLRKREGQMELESTLPVRFVPMTGKAEAPNTPPSDADAP